ncbi:AAA family ATPase [Rhizobium sp. NXC24]|uniref:AAA family ATPase n=1 Tax=Rhizobium sp. NXC24 TaxID=2048897 RepID=UPI00131A5874|nr:AAA family ATPase [Rhizobium sp. NXC24]
MIRIDRDSVSAPDILHRSPGSKADREFQAASRFYENFAGNRQRGAFEFRIFRDPSVKEALQRLFHNKCAYCESVIAATGPGDIDQFRPKSGLISDDGQHFPLHYWWLTNEWSNLYLSCMECNRISYRSSSGSGSRSRSGKGSQFPLEDESLRGEVLSSVEQLAAERPLLLDPCSDDVESILVFSFDGTVSSADRRGLTTITLLGLNRTGLVEERRRTAVKASDLMNNMVRAVEFNNYDLVGSMIEQLKSMMRPSAAYAGMCRQLIGRAISELPGEGFAEFPEIMELARPGVVEANRRQERLAQRALIDFEVQRESYSLEEDSADSTNAYRQIGSRFIESISIQNFRAISRLDLKIADGSERAPWLMLLGENAAGKSTILQAIALALLGEQYRNSLTGALNLDLGGMVKAGAECAEIHLNLSGARDPRILKIYRDGSVSTGGRAAQLILAAYGSTRLLPRRPEQIPTGARYARIENLFDPFVPLIDARNWLLDATPEEFDYAAIAIKNALAIDLDRELVRRDGDVGLFEFGKFIPLGRLCDGYQTVIALVVDILSLVLPTWKTPELAQGLVLIDEVGNHLHPSWKLRFVESMRSVLPGMQIIATTHEPLCLRGLRHGEIAVLHKGPRGGVKLVSDLPSIEGMRVDQILTSEHFGLASTLDPALQAQFDRYNFLLRKTTPTEREKAEILRLRDEINRVQQLGNTERERRLLTAIDRFLALRSDIENETEQTQSEEDLNAELAAIWQEAARRSGPQT